MGKLKKKSKMIQLEKCPICGEEVKLMYFDNDSILVQLNYEEELDIIEESEDEYGFKYNQHGFIQCDNCDADFCKTIESLRELIEWWNTRI